jgi:predicted nuclease of predicted toxin-antitoxin system
MSKIFISIYLDEDVNVLLADLLKARGFEAITTREAGQLSKTDEEQLRYAVSQELTLLTHNRVDFEALTYKNIKVSLDYYVYLSPFFVINNT